MLAQPAGAALARPPERPRTLVAKNGAVWIWPGIPLTTWRGGAIVACADATIRFWISRLHGPEALDRNLLRAIASAAQALTQRDEIAAQRALDALGLTSLSRDGAALARCIAGELDIPSPDIAARNGPHLWTAQEIALHALVFCQHAAASRLAKAGPWDESKHRRWPKGAPQSQGGRFAPMDASGTSEGTPSSPTELPQIEIKPRKPPGIGHNQGPPLEEPPDIPEGPLTDKARNAFVKLAVRWLLLALVDATEPEIAAFIAALQASTWLVQKCYPYIAAYFTPPETLEQLQEDANYPAPGYEIHHFVEKGQAQAEGIPESVWDAPENRVRVPTLKHWEITGWYMTKNKDYGQLSPRDYLRGKSWEEKVRVGRGALIKFGVLKP